MKKENKRGRGKRNKVNRKVATAWEREREREREIQVSREYNVHIKDGAGLQDRQVKIVRDFAYVLILYTIVETWESKYNYLGTI